MFRNARIAVVVPAFNEGEQIGSMLRGLPEYVDQILVVDDGSSDDTAARANAVKDPRVEVIRHARNGGVGMALCTGYREALARGADVVAVMAGDGQMHPGDLAALLTPVVEGAADYAKGNRLAHHDAFARMPLLRFIGNQILSLATRWATGLRVHDSQCGYTALHRNVIERLPWQQLWRGYGYPNDLLARLAEARATICDVVVRPIYADESSGIGFRHALFVIPYVLLRVLARRMLRALASDAEAATAARSLAAPQRADVPGAGLALSDFHADFHSGPISVEYSD
jgi:glycosyltransferase involved in cell wall biosynthesis